MIESCGSVGGSNPIGPIFEPIQLISDVAIIRNNQNQSNWPKGQLFWLKF